MSKSSASRIIIIGAGVAGLAAGCYAQMNGYQSQIFELHTLPGGLCTSWKRRGRNTSATYTFDGCIHWLVGSQQGSSMNKVWQELGATQGKQIVDHEEFIRIRDADGKELVLYTDIDRLQQHMLDLAPGDARVIRRFCRTLRRFTRFDDASEGGGPFARLKMLPFLPDLIRYGKMSTQQFAARFSDPFLRKALAATFDMPDLPMIAIVLTLAWMHNKDAGYPVGGSLAFAQAIEKRYLDLGGQIHYHSRVAKILTEGDRAVGVRLDDGTEHRADIVISAADGHTTIFDMLEGRYATDTVRGYYESLPIFAPVVLVSLGIDHDLSALPHSITCELDEPLDIAGVPRRWIGFRHFCYDPTMAPPGKSVVEAMFPSDHAYWKQLAEEPERYEAEKKDIAIKVITQLDQLLPPGSGKAKGGSLSDQVEVVDVATPLTFERYTGNWQGSMEGWRLTTEHPELMGKEMDKTLPGLEDFYMVGQWVSPGGGLPPAATTARGVIQAICEKHGKPFTTSVPS